MPHLRKRHLSPLIGRTLKYSPIVGILGHRQVGKTTLATALAKNYLTLDERQSLDLAETHPTQLLTENASFPLCIDECQYAPPLFPALKEYVRKRPAPGQFLLTGSVRFTSRKAIRESLTGRIVTWELLPMDLAESHSFPLSNVIPRLLAVKTVEVDLERKPYFTSRSISQSLENGGLPGIFSVRDPSIRSQRFETQITTLLERDLKLILPTTLSFRTLRNLAVQLALNQCQPLEWQSLHRATRISVPTLRKILSALESIFFLRLVSSSGTEKKPVIFFEDQGEATHLSANRYDDLTNLTRFLYTQIRTQTHYRPDLGIQLASWKNRGGAYIPFVFQAGMSRLGVIPSLEETPHSTGLATARSFLRKFPSAKVVLVHPGTNDSVVSKAIRYLPVGKLI